MVTEVAREIGPSFAAVWAQPYHLTLLAYLGLCDRERICSFERKADEIASALRMNWALLAPAQLQKEQSALMADLRAMPGDSRKMTTAEALDLVAQIEREHATKRFVDTTPTRGVS